MSIDSKALKFNYHKDLTIKINVMFFMVISLLVLNDSLRGILSMNFLLVNPIFFVISIFYLVRIYLRHQFNLVILFLVGISSVFILASLYSSGAKIHLMSAIVSLVIPMLFLSVKLNHDQALSALKTFLKIYNPLIILLIIVGLYDYITNYSFQNFLVRIGSPYADLIQLERDWLGVYRYYSFMGHPLQNAKFFLIFFIMNNIYAKYDKPLINGYVVSFITLAGLLLSGSKTALVISILLILFFGYIKRFKFVYLVGIIIAVILFFNSTLFEENLWARFNSDDISSGRLALFKHYYYSLKTGSADLPSFFIGGGLFHSIDIASSFNLGIKNFEFPLIMFAYDYGILASIILYFVTHIYPSIIMIKNKQYYILLVYSLMLLFINTNNGIANLGYDAFAQHCLITLILMHLKPINNKDSKKLVPRQKKIKILPHAFQWS